MLLKRHRSSEEELLPHDVIELILERLPVQALLVFRSVSKKWKSTIDSRRFKERRLQRRRQSRGVYVLFLCVNGENTLKRADNRVFIFGSSVGRIPNSGPLFCYGSCDGIVCLYGMQLDGIRLFFFATINSSTSLGSIKKMSTSQVQSLDSVKIN